MFGLGVVHPSALRVPSFVTKGAQTGHAFPEKGTVVYMLTTQLTHALLVAVRLGSGLVKVCFVGGFVFGFCFVLFC